MPAKISIRFWLLTASAARRAGNALYDPSAARHAPFGIPGEYTRVFYPLMYLLWALALASQIVELYWLSERSPEPSGYWVLPTYCGLAGSVNQCKLTIPDTGRRTSPPTPIS